MVVVPKNSLNQQSKTIFKPNLNFIPLSIRDNSISEWDTLYLLRAQNFFYLTGQLVRASIQVSASALNSKVEILNVSITLSMSDNILYE